MIFLQSKSHNWKKDIAINTVGDKTIDITRESYPNPLIL